MEEEGTDHLMARGRSGESVTVTGPGRI